MPHDPPWLVDYKSVTGEVVSLGDGKQCAVTGKGIVLIKKLIKGQRRSARIEDVLHVPQIKNVYSVGTCIKKGFLVTFKEQIVQKKIIKCKQLVISKKTIYIDYFLK